MEAKKCITCGNDMEEQNVEYVSHWGSYSVTISGVRAYVCKQCGEKVFPAVEARMIQNLTAALSNTSNRPDFLNICEVAQYLRVSKQTVYNMIRDGRVRAHKVGREWRFLPGDIYAFVSDDVGETFQMAAKGGKIDKDDLSLIQKELNNGDK